LRHEQGADLERAQPDLEPGTVRRYRHRVFLGPPPGPQQPEGRRQRADQPVSRQLLIRRLRANRDTRRPEPAGIELIKMLGQGRLMIEIIKELPDNVVGIVATGRVTNEECDDVLRPAMEASLRRHGKIRLYYEIGSRFPGA